MSKWKKVKLGDIATYINGCAFKPSDWSNQGVPIVRIQNLTGSFSETNYYDKHYNSKYEINNGDVLISWSASLGVYVWDKGKAILNQHIFKVVFNKIDVDKTYFIFAVKSLLEKMEKQTHGATMKHITKPLFDNMEFPFPAMEEQKKIAARLDAVSDLLAKQKQLLSEQDTLIQSTFYDMFGDPIKNEKGWNSKKLSELGSLKNGINFQKNDNESDLYCLGVADFKDNKYISDISALQKVPSKSVNLTEDLLKNGDIVFVRSNGNKALVGRCVAVYPNEEAVTFSGFCIRFRKSTTLIKTDYLLYFLKTPQVRNVLAGRGANIQNLNQQILSRVNILCPPLELQRKFAAVAEQIESEKSKIKSAIAETQTLFNALMSEYFEE